MPVYNFKCGNGHTLLDQYYRITDLPKTIPCPYCTAKMEQDYADHIVGFSDSGYPYYDPQTDMTYTSAADKKMKLKMLGCEEGDWKEGGASTAEIHLHEAWKQKKEGKKVLDSAYWLDSDNEKDALKEADKMLDKDPVSIIRKASQTL